MAIEVLSCSQDSDCPNVVVWTKNGAVRNSWGVWEDEEIEPGYEYEGESETQIPDAKSPQFAEWIRKQEEEELSTRQPTDEERAAILEAFREWQVIGNWMNEPVVPTRPDVTRQAARERAKVNQAAEVSK